MTAATGITRRPGLRVRTAGVAMAVTFAVGVVAGLTAPRVSLSLGAPHTTAVDAAEVAVASRAYQDFRRGERDYSVTTRLDAQKAWLIFRAGERGDPPTP